MNQSQCSTQYTCKYICIYNPWYKFIHIGFETKKNSDDIHFKKIQGADYPPIRIYESHNNWEKIKNLVIALAKATAESCTAIYTRPR